MAHPGINFEAWLTDQDGMVPGSYRYGHNIVTLYGKEWLKELVAWQFIDPLEVADDAPQTERRLRWIGVGDGFQPENEGVQKLVAPAIISGSDYIKALPVPVSPPATTFSVKYVVTFPGAELPNPIDISEAGIFVDVDSGGGPGLVTTSPNNIPVAYKSFPAIVPSKTNLNTLTITWEFRF